MTILRYNMDLQIGMCYAGVSDVILRYPEMGYWFTSTNFGIALFVYCNLYYYLL